MKLKHTLAVIGLISITACTAAQWQVISGDLENIAATVLGDIMAGKPFNQVLADTGTEDVSLLVAIINFIEADVNPKITPAQKAAYIAACTPYLAEAKVRFAAQKH